MDDSQPERFFERVREDRALGQEYQSELKGAMEAAVAATIQKVAARHGFRFPLEAARAYLKRKAAELDDEQLAAVAGGAGPQHALGATRVSPSTPYNPLSNPLVLAGIVAAAIAVPLAVGDDDNDAS
jgi:hypothetical protein